MGAPVAAALSRALREAAVLARWAGVKTSLDPPAASSASSSRVGVRPSLYELNASRDRLAAAEADRGHAALSAALAQGVNQGDQDARAAGAERVAQGHRAAVDVDLLE